MKIVFDMDNTLTDELGSTVRPGIIKLLERLKGEGHVLILWTNSSAGRARDILRDHGLLRYFEKFIFREDYDPENSGIMKDIRHAGGDLLIDDDPGEIDYVKSTGKRALVISPYRKNNAQNEQELDELYNDINGSKGFLKKLFSK